MSPLDVIGSQPGRVLRILTGGALIGWGLRHGEGAGHAVAAVGLIPLLAGAADVCLLGPLVRGPLGGAAFRAYRGRTARPSVDIP